MAKTIQRLTGDDILLPDFFTGQPNGADNLSSMVDGISDSTSSNNSIVKRTSDGSINATTVNATTVNATYVDSGGITEDSTGTALPGVSSKLGFFDVSTPIVKPTVTASVSSISPITAADIDGNNTSTEVSVEFNKLIDDVTNLKGDIESINTSLTSLIQALTNLGLIQ